MGVEIAVHDSWPPYRMLAALPTAHDVDRLYTVTGKGAFSFTVLASDPGANRDTIKEGNLVVIRSDMAPYVGRIQHLEEGSAQGTIEVSGDNWASILYERLIPPDCTFANYAAGAIAMSLLRLVNSRNPTGIQPSGATERGSPIRGLFDAGSSYLGDALDNLSTLSGNEWWLLETVGRNRLEASLYWGFERGRDKSRSICLEDGIHFTASKYIRDALGTAKSATTIGGGGAVSDRPTGSRAASSPVQPALARDVAEYLPLDTGQAVLADAAQKLLEKPLTAAESFPITINTKVAWNLLEPGDIVTVIFANTYFGGVQRRVRILAMQPDEAAGECDLAVEVV